MLDDDDDEALRARILAEEHRLLPAVVRAIAERRVVVEGRRVRVLGVGAGNGAAAQSVGAPSPHGRHELLRRRRLRGRDGRAGGGGAAGAPRVAGAAARPRARAGGVRRRRHGAVARAGAAAAARRSAGRRACFKELDCVAVVKRRAPVRARRSGSRSAQPAARPRRPIAAALRARARRARSDRRRRRWRPAIERLDALGAHRRAAAGDGDHAAARTASGSGARSGGWSRCCRRAGTDPLAPLAAEHPFRARGRRAGGARRRRWPRATSASVTEARAFELARRGLHRLEGGLAGAAGAAARSGSRPSAASGARRLEPVEVVMRRGPRRRAAGAPARRDHRLPAAHLGGLVGRRCGRRWAAAAPRAGARATGGRCGSPATATPCRCSSTPEAMPGGDAGAPVAIGDPSRPLIEDNALAVTVGRPGAARARPDPALGRVRGPGPPRRRRRRATCARCAAGCSRRWSGSGPTCAKNILVRRLALTTASRPAGPGDAAGDRASDRQARPPVPSSRRRSTRARRPRRSTSAACRTPPASRTSTWPGARTSPASASRASWSPAGASARLVGHAPRPARSAAAATRCSAS